MTGEEMQRLVADLIGAPASVRDEVKAAFEAKRGIAPKKARSGK